MIIDDEWCKMAGRVLKGYAEENLRPEYWPWLDARFDRFWEPKGA